MCEETKHGFEIELDAWLHGEKRSIRAEWIISVLESRDDWEQDGRTTLDGLMYLMAEVVKMLVAIDFVGKKTPGPISTSHLAEQFKQWMDHSEHSLDAS